MIKIFQINDVNPELLRTQMASFKKYLQEDFEVIVFSSQALTHSPEKTKKVWEVCRALSIRIIEVQKDIAIENAYMKSVHTLVFGGNGRYVGGLSGHGFNYALQWAWEKVISKEQGSICLLHADVFLTEPIKFTDYLQEHALCFIPQHSTSKERPDEITTIWDALFLADMSKLPNPETMVWIPATVEGRWTDTGGPTHYYLKAHPELKILYIGQNGYEDDPSVNFHPARYQFFELGGKRILHYQTGSRWVTDLPGYWNFSKEKSDEYHKKKLAWAQKIIGIEEVK